MYEIWYNYEMSVAIWNKINAVLYIYKDHLATYIYIYIYIYRRPSSYYTWEK